MLLEGKIVRNLVLGMILLNAALLGLFFYASAKQPWLPGAIFPGKFGPGLALEYTGNMVELATLLLINAFVIVLVGFKDTLHALWAGMRLSPKTLRRFLNERAGLASDISGIVAQAVQEEEKLELSYLDRAGWVLRLGLLLLLVGVPLFCISLARADAPGAPMFAVEQIAVPNSNVSNEEIWRFAVDQIADPLLLNIPEVFHLRLSRLDPNSANLWLCVLVLLYRMLVGFGVLLGIIASMRMRALWRFAIEVALPVKEIVALESEIAAGSEGDRSRHHVEEHYEPHTEELAHHREENGHHDNGHRHDEERASEDETPRHADHTHANGHDARTEPRVSDDSTG